MACPETHLHSRDASPPVLSPRSSSTLLVPPAATSRIFGPGSVLPALVVTGAVASAVYLDPTAARAAKLTAAVVTMLPFVIMKTGHPDYLGSASRRKLHVAVGVAAASVAASAAVLHATTDGDALRNPLFATAIAAGILSVILALCESRPPVLGPFFDFDRRAAVLTVRIVCLRQCVSRPKPKPTPRHSCRACAPLPKTLPADERLI